MAKGDNDYLGLAVPLQGNFEITAQSASFDVMTLTAAASGTGDFIVCQSQNGTEVFVVEDDGKMTVGGEGITITSGGLTVTAGDAVVTAGDVIIGDGYYLRFSSNALTTAPTTGLTRGDLLMYSAANVWTLGYCTDNQTLVSVAFTNN